MTVHNELPLLVPWVNIVLSALALLASVVFWAKSGGPILGNAAMIIACLVLLAGALFQANLLSLDLWIVLGTGGRFLVAAAAIAFATLPRPKVELVDRADDEREHVV